MGSRSARRTSYLALATDDDSKYPDAGSVHDANREPGACTKIRKQIYPAGFGSEFKKMLKITWPICLTQVCQMLIGPVSLVFCGHLEDTVKLDGAALAISMINVICISVAQGLGTACDTFFSQSYGSKNRKQMGLYMQRALCIFLLASVVVITVSINMELILRLLGQDPEVAALTGRYMLIFAPGATAFFLYVVLSKYIQNQDIVIPNVIIGVIANLINAGLQYMFIIYFNLDVEGSAIAQATTYIIMLLMTAGYIVCFMDYKDTWPGWSVSSFYHWGQFCQLAIPGMFMVCLEWWGFEIGVMVSGLLGKTELGAQSVLLQIDIVWFQVPLGIQIATAIRIGQYLGSESKAGAITAGRLGITVIVILQALMAGVFLAFQYQLPTIFTNVPDIVQLVGDLIPIVAIYLFFDGFSAICKSILFATGRQAPGAIIMFVCYYCLALPIGIPLMFYTSLRSAAYWWALAANLMLQSIILGYLVVRTD